MISEKDQRGLRVLVIEDNRANLLLTTHLLAAFNHTPLEATDGETGLALARREKPDLILCDVQLPDIDGTEVARRLKEDVETRRIPLVAVTALAMAGDRESLLSAGFDGYITKPIEPESFITTVEGFVAVENRRTILVSPPRPELQAADPPSLILAQHRGTICIVDDHKANLELLRTILEAFGYSVIATRGVSEALAAIAKSKPDLVLSDWHMPEGGGPALITMIRADPELRFIPVIFLSCSAQYGAEESSGLALGADGFLRYPIDPRALLNKIEDCSQRVGKR